MAWVYGHLHGGIAGSKPAGGMGTCLLRVLYVVRYEVSATADHSPRGDLPSVVITLIAKLRHCVDPDPLWVVASWGKIPGRKSVCCCLLI